MKQLLVAAILLLPLGVHGADKADTIVCEIVVETGGYACRFQDEPDRKITESELAELLPAMLSENKAKGIRCEASPICFDETNKPVGRNAEFFAIGGQLE